MQIGRKDVIGGRDKAAVVGKRNVKHLSNQGGSDEKWRRRREGRRRSSILAGRWGLIEGTLITF